MYYGQKPFEFCKSYSNESIFSIPSIKNCKTPLLTQKDKQKFSSVIETDPPIKKKHIQKLQKIDKFDKKNKNLITSSLDFNEKFKNEELFHSKIMKKTEMSQNIRAPSKDYSKKLSGFDENNEGNKYLTVEEILKISHDDLETNFEDPRNPVVFYNIIRKKFLFYK